VHLHISSLDSSKLKICLHLSTIEILFLLTYLLTFWPLHLWMWLWWCSSGRQRHGGRVVHSAADSGWPAAVPLQWWPVILLVVDAERLWASLDETTRLFPTHHHNRRSRSTTTQVSRISQFRFIRYPPEAPLKPMTRLQVFFRKSLSKATFEWILSDVAYTLVQVSTFYFFTGTCVPDRVKPSFVIFDIRPHWRSRARMSNIHMTAWPGLAQPAL